MKYKLELINDLPEVEAMIANVEDDLFVLKNDRDDRVIQSKRGEKSLDRHAKAVLDAQSKLDAATSISASLPAGPLKDKQLGIIETQKARLFNLNLPSEVASVGEVVNVEIEKEKQEVLITFFQDVLDALNVRKTELSAG